MEQADILRHTVETLDQLSVPYMVVGSIASIAYGESRFTQDLDVVIDLKLSRTDPFLSYFSLSGFYWSLDAVREAVRTSSQFNIIHPA